MLCHSTVFKYRNGVNRIEEGPINIGDDIGQNLSSDYQSRSQLVWLDVGTCMLKTHSFTLMVTRTKFGFRVAEKIINTDKVKSGT